MQLNVCGILLYISMHRWCVKHIVIIMLRLMILLRVYKMLDFYPSVPQTHIYKRKWSHWERTGSWWRHQMEPSFLWPALFNQFYSHGRATHICVSNITIIASDNGLSPGRRQAIIWINACILLIGPLGTNFSEILVEILTFSFMKMRLKVSSAKWSPFCLGLNVLRVHPLHAKCFRWNKNTYLHFM